MFRRASGLFSSLASLSWKAAINCSVACFVWAEKTKGYILTKSMMFISNAEVSLNNRMIEEKQRRDKRY